jgi:hypothetical protein
VSDPLATRSGFCTAIARFAGSLVVVASLLGLAPQALCFRLLRRLDLVATPQPRSFTDFRGASALNDNGADALDQSPPSILIRSLAAPSTRDFAAALVTANRLAPTDEIDAQRSHWRRDKN